MSLYKVVWDWLPTSSRPRAFICGARRSVLRAKGLFKVFENGGNSLQLCLFEQYIDCLLLTTPKLGRGKKVNYNRLYTIGTTSLKSLPPDPLPMSMHAARLLCFTKRIQIIKEHKRKHEWNNFTTKHGLDLFCLACCAGDYYFHKQNKKNLLDDDAFDVSDVFFSWQRAGLSQVRQN